MRCGVMSMACLRDEPKGFDKFAAFSHHFCSLNCTQTPIARFNPKRASSQKRICNGFSAVFLSVGRGRREETAFASSDSKHIHRALKNGKRIFFSKEKRVDEYYDSREELRKTNKKLDKKCVEGEAGRGVSSRFRWVFQLK